MSSSTVQYCIHHALLTATISCPNTPPYRWENSYFKVKVLLQKAIAFFFFFFDSHVKFEKMVSFFHITVQYTKNYAFSGIENFSKVTSNESIMRIFFIPLKTPPIGKLPICANFQPCSSLKNLIFARSTNKHAKWRLCGFPLIEQWNETFENFCLHRERFFFK